MYKIGIVGSRSFKDYAKMVEIVFDNFKIKDIELIVSGGAKGADSLAEKFSKEYLKKDPLVFYPDLHKYNIFSVAAYKRNEQIVNAVDILLAFWDGQSNGTANAIDIAKREKKRIIVCNFI